MSGLELISHTPTHPNGLPPLLLVHGAFCSASIWEPHFIPHFARRGFTVHALSLRGHGRSEGAESLAWASISDYVEDLCSVAEGLDEAPVLIGHSMGGMVVQRFLDGGLAVPAAVLMASVPPHGLWSSGWGMALHHPYLASQLTLLQAFGPNAADPDAIRRTMFSDRVSPEEARRYEELMQAESRRVGLDLYGPQPVPRDTAVPLLVLGAGRDFFFPPSEVHSTARAYGTEAEIFPEMGHVMMLEPDWRKAADRIVAWLRRTLPAATRIRRGGSREEEAAPA